MLTLRPSHMRHAAHLKRVNSKLASLGERISIRTLYEGQQKSLSISPTQELLSLLGTGSPSCLLTARVRWIKLCALAVFQNTLISRFRSRDYGKDMRNM